MKYESGKGGERGREEGEEGASTGEAVQCVVWTRQNQPAMTIGRNRPRECGLLWTPEVLGPHTVRSPASQRPAAGDLFQKQDVGTSGLSPHGGAAWDCLSHCTPGP